MTCISLLAMIAICVYFCSCSFEWVTCIIYEIVHGVMCENSLEIFLLGESGVP